MMEQGIISRNTRILAIGNQKGGVSKTTNVVHIAAALGELGRRCLIWDLDMNCGASKHLGIRPDAKFLGTYEVLTEMEEPGDVIVTPEDDIELPKNVHIIPARRNLENLDETLAGRDKWFSRPDVLVEPLRKLAGQYDYILLDTAPNATTPTIAAYKAAEYFILCAIPEHFAIDGLGEALDDIGKVRRRGNPDLKLLGVVLACVRSNYRLSKKLTSYVEEKFSPEGGPNLKFATEIGRAQAVPEAQEAGRTLFETNPSHKVTEQYRQLVREIEERIAQHEANVTQAGQVAAVASAPTSSVMPPPTMTPEPAIIAAAGEGVANG
jgi:chromosome partitioning protein